MNFKETNNRNDHNLSTITITRKLRDITEISFRKEKV